MVGSSGPRRRSGSCSERVGFAPRVEPYAPQLSATIDLVAASLGAPVVPQSMRALCSERYEVAGTGVASDLRNAGSLTAKFASRSAGFR